MELIQAFLFSQILMTEVILWPFQIFGYNNDSCWNND